LERKVIMLKRDIFKNLGLLFLFLSIPVLEIHSLEISVNGRIVRRIDDSFLKDKLYLVSAGGSLSRGISLDEIIPLFVSIYRIELQGDSLQSLEQEDLSDQISSFYLVPADKDFTLYHPRGKVEGLKSLSIYGEELAEKPLEVWVSWEGVPLLKKEIARFADLHGLSIKILEVPSTDSKLLSVLRGGGAPPDAVMIQADYVPTLVSAGAIQNVDFFLSDSLTEKGVESFTLEGRIWAAPFYFDSQLLFYNTQIIKEGIPFNLTLQDLEILSEKLKTRGVIPLCWNAYSAYWLVPFQVSFGKIPFLEPEGGIRIDDLPTNQAISYLLYLTDRGYLSVMERDAMISEFAAGNVAMILSGSYSIPQFMELGIPFDVVPYPKNQRTGFQVSPLLDFKAFAIPRKARNPLLARRLIQYLTGVGVQQRFTAAVSKLPADERAWEMIQESNPYYEALRHSADYGVVVPPQRSYQVFKGTMWKLLRFALERQLSVEETLKQGQSVIDANLQDPR